MMAQMETTKTSNKKELKLQDLLRYYKEGEDADQAIYAEQRSNLMLVAGNHYSRKGSRFYNRVRSDANLTKEQKIRITKNHLQRVCKIYENNILSYAPAAIISPRNQNELQDQKSAELNNAVWQYTCDRQKMRQKNREYCQDFTRIGEVHTKIYWDDMKGEYLGDFPVPVDPNDLDPDDLEVDDETGEYIMPEPEMEPKFAGDLVYERIFGFNLGRAKEAKALSESWFINHRKMVDIDDLKKRVGDDDEKLAFIESSRDETYLVFDGQQNNYSESQNQCLVIEMFIRPCASWPRGYFYMHTKLGVLFEGELPFGIFPIISAGFDEVPTNPRYHSIIKQLRPFQAELNRMASAQAETAITIGQDKVFIQAGSKLQNGGTLPGVNAYTIAGGAPTILPGRVGEQWFQPMKDNIQEMYLVANIAEENEEKQTQMDPQAMLFKSIEQKKKYVLYVMKFTQFLTDVCETSLALLKEYLADDALIPMIGKSEMVNISEFKTSKPLNYSIKIESGTEDMESKMGKQLLFNHIIQYVGSQLDKKELGRMIRTSPYANTDLAFEDLTLDFDNATNMILALDRGEMMPPNIQDDCTYMMKRLVARTRKADFKRLDQRVQANYQTVYDQYTQIIAKQQADIQRAQQGYIPMSGMAVVCDLYVPDPSNPTKTMRARVPYDSLTWLLKAVEKQGMNQATLMQQQQGALADISRQMQANPQIMANAPVPQPNEPQGRGGVPMPASDPHLQQPGGPGQSQQPSINPA